MRIKLFTQKAVIYSFFVSIFFTLAFSQVSLASSWYAQLYPKNNKYIEVALDVRDVPPSIELRNVSVKLKFYDSIKKIFIYKDLMFTSVNIKALQGGKVYKRYIPNPYPSLKFVEPKLDEKNIFTTSVSSPNDATATPTDATATPTDGTTTPSGDTMSPDSYLRD